jgi:Cytochrome c
MHRMFSKRILVSSLIVAGAGVSACAGDAPTLPSDEPPVTIASRPPPPISGGTLTVTHGGLAVASDPDRDLVWLVDLGAAVAAASSAGANPAVHHVSLQAGDEPGRVVLDGAGRAHVALRGGGAVATIDLASASVVDRTSVCSAPRGLAYDPGSDVVHVACAGGELLTLPAAGGAPVRRLQMDRDLRDVVVSGQNLLVSRLKTAQVLLLDPNGAVINRQAPADVLNEIPVSKSGVSTPPSIAFEPTVAWRLIPMPDGTAAMVHQRALDAIINVTQPGGYGNSGGGNGPPCDGSIVHSTVSTVDLEGNPALGVPAPSIVGASLPVDIATDLSGNFAIASAGSGAVFFTSASALAAESGPFECSSATATPVPGEPIAIASLAGVAAGIAGNWLVQTRETTVEGSADAIGSAVPTLTILGSAGPTILRLSTPDDSRADTGHDLFHHNASKSLALSCAGCHPEGHEDGHTWVFDTEGKRRTQTVSGQVLETAPLHWNGDLADLSAVMTVVFVHRMGGAPQGPQHIAAFADWIETIPAFPASPTGTAAQVEHGEELFRSAETGCTSCHRGEHFTDDLNHDVGTGALSNTRRAYQVPTMIGVAARAPFFHDGCAATLEDRFDPTQAACNGGDLHGHVSQLSPADVADLVAYLETL